MKSRKNLLSFFVFAVSTCLLFLFQNCGPVPFFRSNNPSQMGGGNGEGYTGMSSRTGLYYKIKPRFSCPGAPASTSPGIAATVLVTLTDATQTDSCTGVSQNISLGNITFAANNTTILNWMDSLFEKRTTPPNLADPNLLIAVAHCTSNRTNLNAIPTELDITIYQKSNETYLGKEVMAMFPVGQPSYISGGDALNITFASSAGSFSYLADSWKMEAISTDPPNSRRATMIDIPTSTAFTGSCGYQP